MSEKLLSLFLRLTVFLLKKTYRLKSLNNLPEAPDRNYVYALWHQDTLSTMYTFLDAPPHGCVISRSKLGRMFSSVLKKYGHISAQGSSSRGGRRALLEIIRMMNTHKVSSFCAIDGSRGPAKVPKHGVFKIAEKTGAPIIPLSAYPIHHWELSSWDKCRFPKPFTTIIVYYGPPIKITDRLNSDELEKYSLQLKEVLDQGEQKILSSLKQ